MKQIKDSSVIFLKGLTVGASMLIPGVSGGTMAIILGIYDRLIHAISSFRKDKKRNAFLLLTFGGGAVLGILLLSKLIWKLVTAFHMPMMYLFIGAILASVPPLYRKSRQRTASAGSIVALLLGFGLVWALSLLPSGLFQFGEETTVWSYLMLFIAGLIVAVALVLPGISASYMLLMLGMYDITLQAIQAFHLAFLIPLLLGVGVGTILTTGLLEKAMQQFPHITYPLIIGFVLGSVLEVFPGPPSGIEWVICPMSLLLGFFFISYLSVHSSD